MNTPLEMMNVQLLSPMTLRHRAEDRNVAVPSQWPMPEQMPEISDFIATSGSAKDFRRT
jgi:hypothetical protein